MVLQRVAAALLLSAPAAKSPGGADTGQPEQVHLALTANASAMSVTWTTLTPANEQQVEFAAAPPTAELSCATVLSSAVTTASTTATTTVTTRRTHLSEAFDNGRSCSPTRMGGRITFLHHATMGPLVPGRRYCYRVGSAAARSPAFSFINVDTGRRPISFAVTGDFGVNRQLGPMPAARVGVVETLPALLRSGSEFLVHYGDLAYNLHTSGRPGDVPPVPTAVCGNGTTGDHFLRMMEMYAARRPWMVIPGNHERQFNFTHLHHRFDMPGKTTVGAPGSGDNHFYSLDVGFAHLVFIDTERWFTNRGPLDDPEAVFVDTDGAATGGELLRRQWDWLVEDLERANRNRAHRPWLIVFGHKPLHCSSSGQGPDAWRAAYKQDTSMCGKTTNATSILREGWKGREPSYGLEQLFHRMGVDAYLCGHVHDCKCCSTGASVDSSGTLISRVLLGR